MKTSGFVTVKGEMISVKKVKFIDIEEDFSGRDLMTFEYEGKVYQSYILK
jgi:hypothetical protein